MAYGEQTSINQLAQLLKANLSKFDSKISKIEFEYRGNRTGDVAHSLASIEKGINVLDYRPEYSIKKGLMETCEWYFKNL